MKDLTDGILEKELEYAKSIGNDTLQKCIDRIKQNDWYFDAESSISNDFAPRSFYFQRIDKYDKQLGNGGIIFHGPDDGFGSGSAPSFSISIDDSKEIRWEIHT
jgi:hypothetical protein